MCGFCYLQCVLDYICEWGYVFLFLHAATAMVRGITFPGCLSSICPILVSIICEESFELIPSKLSQISSWARGRLTPVCLNVVVPAGDGHVNSVFQRRISKGYFIFFTVIWV